MNPGLTPTIGVRYELQFPFVPDGDYYSRPLNYANTFGYSGVARTATRTCSALRRHRVPRARSPIHRLQVG